MSAVARQPMTFALAGELVSTPAHAKRILVDAIKTGKEWLVPQAQFVLARLRAVEAHVGGPRETTIADTAIVSVGISGRVQSLEMPWAQARDKYVKAFGEQAIVECADCLAKIGRWIGTTGPTGEQYLSVTVCGGAA